MKSEAVHAQEQGVADSTDARAARISGQQTQLTDALPGPELAEQMRFAAGLFGISPDLKPTASDQEERIARNALSEEPRAASQSNGLELGLDRRARATAGLVRERFPSTSSKRWLEKAPYQDPEFVERWRRDLAAAGLD